LLPPSNNHGMASFKENLLKVMDQKLHWGWEFLSQPGLHRDQMLIHFQQEYETYVRDFPIFLARILGRMNVGHDQLKKEIVENLYEEQTGGLSFKFSNGQSHPALFLKMMSGLGYKTENFQNIRLLPTSLGYRCFLDRVTLVEDWRIGVALLTLFVEGSVQDRERMKNKYKEKVKLEKKLKEHGLIKNYGLKIKDADLIRVHYSVEGDHRKSAWDTLLKAIPKDLEPIVTQRMLEALELWLLFRDGVCLEMGLEDARFRELALGL